jgi:S-adenosylmethionine:tRNA ribosyltransferase-isomerase
VKALEGLVDFQLPSELEATSPAEVRGASRDDVRLMVAERATGRIEHRHFTELPDVLAAGDLVVVNTSATLPAAVPAIGPGGEPLEVHLSTRLPTDWSVELRVPDGPSSQPFRDGRPGWHLALPVGASVRLLSPLSPGSRLWVATLDVPELVVDREPIRSSFPGKNVEGYLDRYGRPIRYQYTGGDWPLTAYQTVYATEAGSAEMPSAGRALTTEIITRLVARGIDVAPILLHTGVSSLEDHEPPYAEWFRVPADTARRVRQARQAGGRVIAVGTTAVRALESAGDGSGGIGAAEGWTELVIGPERGVTVVDGLLTGWHEPGASHLAMLEAAAGRALLERSYAEALDRGYLWHEFGDLHLILP